MASRPLVSNVAVGPKVRTSTSAVTAKQPLSFRRSTFSPATFSRTSVVHRQQRLSFAVQANYDNLDVELLAEFEAAVASLKATEKADSFKMATQLVHPDQVVDDPYMSTNIPVYQTATFGQPSATTFGEYDYTRSGNPTRTALEKQMASLEGAAQSFAFASGMTALAVVCSLVKSGQRIVAGTDVYGGTARLLANVVPGRGIAVTNANTANLAAMRAAITPDTALVILESPTNPRMQVIDIRAIADMAHAVGALVVVDNSIMAPCFQRVLDLGADISMTSATKFICGHSDVTGGILSCKTQTLADRVYFLQNAEGASLGPLDCWLCIRGLKTMSLRMEKQAENAQILAEWLEAHPSVKKVNYPGLKSNAGYELHKRQATSPGSLISFTTGDVEVSKRVVEETQLFKITVSFGNVGSLISLPCFMSHASIPAEVRAARGLPDDLVRISAGIEDVKDLIADLEQAMPIEVAPSAAPKTEEGLLARIKYLEEELLN